MKEELKDFSLHNQAEAKLNYDTDALGVGKVGLG